MEPVIDRSRTDRDVPCEATRCVGGLSRVEVFSLLANEDRLAILEAVRSASERDDLLYPVPFSRLREVVGVEDSGRFSYHLRELDGHLLRHTSEGYALREETCDRLYGVLGDCLERPPVR